MAANSDRYSGGSSSAYSPLMRSPATNRVLTIRTVLALVLTLLCPPLGVLYMWRAGVFRVRGRAILTAIACVELGIIFALNMPGTALTEIIPTPGSPTRITAVSEGEYVSALSNMDELLGLIDTTQEVAEVTEPTTDGGEIDGLFDANTAQQALTTEEARQQAILDTIVYSVYNGAKFYHVAGTCRDQTNRRALTIREAISEGLKPCGRCNPPTL